MTLWPFPKERAGGGQAVTTPWPFPRGGPGGASGDKSLALSQGGARGDAPLGFPEGKGPGRASAFLVDQKKVRDALTNGRTY